MLPPWIYCPSQLYVFTAICGKSEGGKRSKNINKPKSYSKMIYDEFDDKYADELDAIDEFDGTVPLDTFRI